MTTSSPMNTVYSTSSLNALSIREHNEFVDKVLRSQVVEEILEEEKSCLSRQPNSRNEDTILEIDDSIKGTWAS